MPCSRRTSRGAARRGPSPPPPRLSPTTVSSRPGPPPGGDRPLHGCSGPSDEEGDHSSASVGEGKSASAHGLRGPGPKGDGPEGQKHAHVTVLDLGGVAAIPQLEHLVEGALWVA